MSNLLCARTPTAREACDAALVQDHPAPEPRPHCPPPRAADRQVRIDHVGFGLVLGEDGKKFRSRSGDVVRLVELLDEAKQRCVDTIKERRWA